MKDFIAEFQKFLEEYGVLGMAIAFVMGLAVKDLVSATVDDLIMPVVEVFLPEGSWETAILNLAGIEFKIGHFAAAAIDFVLIALLIFVFVRHGLKKEEVGKI